MYVTQIKETMRINSADLRKKVTGVYIMKGLLLQPLLNQAALTLFNRASQFYAIQHSNFCIFFQMRISFKPATAHKHQATIFRQVAQRTDISIFPEKKRAESYILRHKKAFTPFKKNASIHQSCSLAHGSLVELKLEQIQNINHKAFRSMRFSEKIDSRRIVDCGWEQFFRKTSKRMKIRRRVMRRNQPNLDEGSQEVQISTILQERPIDLIRFAEGDTSGADCEKISPKINLEYLRKRVMKYHFLDKAYRQATEDQNLKKVPLHVLKDGRFRPFAYLSELGHSLPFGTKQQLMQANNFV